MATSPAGNDSTYKTWINYSYTNTATTTTVTWTAYCQAKVAVNDTGFFPPGFHTEVSGENVSHYVDVSSMSAGQTKTLGPYSFSKARDTYDTNIHLKVYILRFMDSTAVSECEITVPKLQSYTITYYTNGGSWRGYYWTTLTETKYYNKPVSLSSQQAVLEGYTHNGWNTNSSGTGTHYNFAAIYNGNANLNLYAEWKENTSTITYDANGGTGAPAAQTKKYWSTVQVPGQIPKRTNYVFNGWYESDNHIFFPGDTIPQEYTGDMTLLAQWAPSSTNVIINAIKALRVEQNGSDNYGNSDGEYGLVSFSWLNGSLYYVPANASEGQFITIEPDSYRIEVTGIFNGQTYVKTNSNLIALTDQEKAQQYVEKAVLDESTTQGETLAYTISLMDLIHHESTGVEFQIRVYLYFTFDVDAEEADKTYKQAIGSSYISPAMYIIDISSDGMGIGFGMAVRDGENGDKGIHSDMDITLKSERDFYITVEEDSQTDALYNALNALGWILTEE